MYPPVWGQLGLPFGNYAVFITKTWMNPKFYSQTWVLYSQSTWCFDLVIQFSSASTCNETQALPWIVPGNSQRNCCISILHGKCPKPTEQTFESELKEFHKLPGVTYLQSVTLISQSPTLDSAAIPPKTDPHIFLRMILSYPVLVSLYLKFSSYSGLLLESSSSLLLSYLKNPVCRMISFKNTSLLFLSP